MVGMKKNRIRLTESDLSRIVRGVLNEKFYKDSMKQAVKAGGGLSRDRFNDARGLGLADLSNAEAMGERLPQELVWALRKHGIWFNVPLNQQLIRSKDGDYIVLKTPLASWDDTKKLRGRLQNSLDDEGYEPSMASYLADKYKEDSNSNFVRRYKQDKKRGVKKARGQKPEPKDDK